MLTPVRRNMSKTYPFHPYSPTIEMVPTSAAKGVENSTEEDKIRIDAVASRSPASVVEQACDMDNLPEKVVPDSEMSLARRKRKRNVGAGASTYLRCVCADDLANQYPLSSGPWIWGKAPEGVFNSTQGGCYVEPKCEDTNWCMVPISHTGLVTGTSSFEVPALPNGMATLNASLSYNNITTYSSGVFNAFTYFRMRVSEDLPPYSTTYSGVAGGALVGGASNIYYASPTRSLSVGRGLYYYLINTTTFSGDIANAYFWVNQDDLNDWIVLGSTASAQADITGFIKIPPSSLFWSVRTANSFTRWTNFTDACYPLDTITVTDSGYGVLSLGDEKPSSWAPTFFINTGTPPEADYNMYSTGSCLWMFVKWLDALYLLNVDIDVSFELGYGRYSMRLTEGVTYEPDVASQLNGNNGEWTNGDDMPPKKVKTGDGKNKKKHAPVRNTRAPSAPLQRGLITAAHRPKQRVPRGLPLTACARNFLTACVNPFGCTGKDIFLPYGYSAPTYRVRGFMRVMVAIGTGGVGFVSLVPTVCNDAPCIWYTTSAYTGTAFIPYTDVATPVLSTGVVSAAMSTLPFSSSQIIPNNADESYASSGMDGTCVSWGIEVLNASTEVNLGGTITAYSDPNRSSLYGATQAQLAGFMDAQVVLGTRQRVGLSVYPIGEDETEFSPLIRVRNNDGLATAAHYPMNWNYGTAQCTYAWAPASSNVIMFTGQPGSQYLVNIVGYNEYSGLQTQLVNRAKIVDPQGYSKVLDVLSRARMMCQSQGSRLIDAVGRAEREVATLLQER